MRSFILLSLLTCGSFAAFAAEPAAENTVKDTPWCTVTAPKQAKVGEKAAVQVVLKAGAISTDSTLRIDVHKYVGTARKPGAGHAKPVEVKAGAGIETSYSYTPPADASAFAFVVYVLPAGTNDWASKSHATEVGVSVVE